MKTWIFLKCLIALFMVIYISMMLIKPWFDGDFDWIYVQRVWSNWQPFNSAMIAFISALIGLFVVHRKEAIERIRLKEEKEIELVRLNEEKKRNLDAARAFLPSALSEIITYCKNCYESIDKAILINGKNSHHIYIQNIIEPIPDWLEKSFKDVVYYADKEDSIFIAKIFSDLQIIQARLSIITEENNPDNKNLATIGVVYERIKELGEVVSKVNRLFPFAREGLDLKKSAISSSELGEAYYAIGCSDLRHPELFN